MKLLRTMLFKNVS